MSIPTDLQSMIDDYSLYEDFYQKFKLIQDGIQGSIKACVDLCSECSGCRFEGTKVTELIETS